MTKHLMLFVAAFIGGAVLALAVRSAFYQPYAGHTGHPEPPAYAPQVNNTAPAEPRAAGAHSPPAPVPASPARDPHAGHEHATPAAQPINTVCPICGMPVDPSLKPAEYQGQLVGFGCRACPPKFAREPDRYGPAALKNEVVED